MTRTLVECADPQVVLSVIDGWPAVAQRLVDHGDSYEAAVRKPEWGGQSAGTVVTAAVRHNSGIADNADQITALADTARAAMGPVISHRNATLELISDAEKAGFVVNDDLSVDTERLALRPDANEHQVQIRQSALNWWTAENQAAKQMRDGGQSLLDNTAHTGIQLVDYDMPLYPGGPFPLDPGDPRFPGSSIEVGDDAINNITPILIPSLKPHDDEFNTSDKNRFQRTVIGNEARANGEAAVLYLRSRGWNTAADIIEHYLANESGGRDSSMARPFRLSTAQTDALANDSHNGYGDGRPTVPDLLTSARRIAIENAARSGQAIYTEVYGTETNQAAARGWNPVAGSDPNNVYGLGRYSVQVVTQVDVGPGHDPIVRQRFYVYDYTDYAHPGSGGSSPIERAKTAAIDDLATLRDIGWARGFDTFGTSSITTFPR